MNQNVFAIGVGDAPLAEIIACGREPRSRYTGAEFDSAKGEMNRRGVANPTIDDVLDFIDEEDAKEKSRKHFEAEAREVLAAYHPAYAAVMEYLSREQVMEFLEKESQGGAWEAVMAVKHSADYPVRFPPRGATQALRARAIQALEARAQT